MGKFEEFRTDTDEYIPPEIFLPYVVDIEVTDKCEFRCPNCWGTKITNGNKDLSPDQWLKIFKKFDCSADDFVGRVVITGGEPLMYRNLGKIVAGLVDSEIFVSLSTTGLDRYNQLKGILDQDLATIGLPVDAPTPEANSIWRRHRTIGDGGLSCVLQTIKWIQNDYPTLPISVRSVVHKGNSDLITDIPDFLLETGVDISELRWVVYEELRREPPEIIGWHSPYNRLTATGAIASKENPAQYIRDIEEAGFGFREVVVRTIGKMANRKFIINPAGDCRIAVPSDRPGELEEKEYGNVVTEFDDVIELLNADKRTNWHISPTAHSKYELDDIDFV